MDQLFKPWGDCVDQQTQIATLRCLPVVFHNVVSALLIFVGAVALFMILYSAIMMITSGGDPKKITAARQIMTYAIIGAVLVLSSFAILYFIGYITGSTNRINNIDCLSTPNAAGCN